MKKKKSFKKTKDKSSGKRMKDKKRSYPKEDLFPELARRKNEIFLATL
jgi:hypothetical protein